MNHLEIFTFVAIFSTQFEIKKSLGSLWVTFSLNIMKLRYNTFRVNLYYLRYHLDVKIKSMAILHHRYSDVKDKEANIV